MTPPEREVRLIDPPEGYMKLDDRVEARHQFWAGLDTLSRGRLHKWLQLEILGWGIWGPEFTDKKIASAVADSIIRHLAGSSD
jgi:hypothetical protein